MKVIINNITVKLTDTLSGEDYLRIKLQEMGFNKKEIVSIKIEKRSIDSRKKSEIKFMFNLCVELIDGAKIPNGVEVKEVQVKEKEVLVNLFSKDIRVAIIGAGPAGLVAAYRLCLLGYSPMIFEQGEKVEERDVSVQKFVEGQELNVYSNIQFGEGGAGTYSDGKLNTRIKSGYIDDVFELFVASGAQEQIMWDYKPHIGTDVLKVVVKNIRKKIEELGGKFYFSTMMTSLTTTNDTIKSIEVMNVKNNLREVVAVDKLILAIGHSARDTYKMLHTKKVAMRNKPFAVGARIEHPRHVIDKLMYGESAGNELLGAATYSLAYNNKAEERGVFSFCMCPGGEVVNAASEVGGSLVNGMSYSDRNGNFSNSALVVTVRENEFGQELFSGMEFQRKLEQTNYNICKGYGAVYQNVKDFMSDKKSTSFNKTSYKMNLVQENMNGILPKFIVDNMRDGLQHFNKLYSGFVSKDSHLIGFETRTSAPVVIERDIKGESLSIRGVYPIGEGAGYAGGITSSAVDALKIVDLSFARKINE